MSDRLKRHRLRFSLRTMFVVMTLAAVGTFWALHEARSRTRAIEMIKQVGGLNASFTFEYEFSGAGGFIPNAKPPGKPLMKQILGEYYDTRVRAIAIWTPKITDAEVRHFTIFAELDWLALSDTSITDESLPYIARLKNLTRLDLERTGVTYEGVRAICRALPNTDVFSDFYEVDDELNIKPWSAAQQAKAEGR